MTTAGRTDGRAGVGRLTVQSLASGRASRDGRTRASSRALLPSVGPSRSRSQPPSRSHAGTRSQRRLYRSVDDRIRPASFPRSLISRTDRKKRGRRLILAGTDAGLAKHVASFPSAERPCHSFLPPLSATAFNFLLLQRPNVCPSRFYACPAPLPSCPPSHLASRLCTHPCTSALTLPSRTRSCRLTNP